MAIATVSRTGKSENVQSLETGTESDRRGKDEFESDADYKEMTSVCGSDDYLLRWLPNITNHKQVSVTETKPSQCEERKEKKDQIERLCTTPVSSRDTFFKPASPNRQTKEADAGYVSSGNKVFRKITTKSYFEAIKCSPMKLRQSIATRHKVSGKSSRIVRQHPRNPMKDRVPKDQASSAVVETTSDPVSRQLGSLNFQTKNSERCQSELPYSTRHLVGGKMGKSRRNMHKPTARNSDELRVRCESVVIYVKSLVSHEKPLVQLSKPRKEAWRKTSLALKSEEDYTKLPELGVKASAILREKEDGKFSTELEDKSKGKQEQKQTASFQSSQSHSMKTIMPFGELQHTIEECTRKAARLVTPEELKVLERKPKVQHEQNSRKKREYFYDNQEACRRNSPEKSKRRVTSMVITQLGTPRKTVCINQPSTTATPSVPLTKTRIGTADVNGLFLGRENLPRQKAGARLSYNQRKRADLGIKAKERLQTERSDHELAGKYFLSTESDAVSLTIGGTRLFREQRGLHENFGEGEEIEDIKEQRGYLRNSLLHSHYIT